MEYYQIWQQYQISYFNLRQKFLEISSPHINAMALASLIQNYNILINSKRVSSQIKNLPDLLRILENRNGLSYKCIEPFKFIATEYVKDPVLENLIKHYEREIKNQQVLPLFNVYECQSGEYNKTVQRNYINSSTDESMINENSTLLHFMPSSGLDQSTNNESLLLQLNNIVETSTVISIDDYCTANNINFNENNKFNCSYRIIITTILVMVICIVLVVIIFYTKSPVLEEATSTTPIQQPAAYNFTVQPTFSLPQTSTWGQTTSSITDLQTKGSYN